MNEITIRIPLAEYSAIVDFILQRLFLGPVIEGMNLTTMSDEELFDVLDQQLDETLAELGHRNKKLDLTFTKEGGLTFALADDADDEQLEQIKGPVN